MTKNPETTGPITGQPLSVETKQQKFERVLSREQFKPLKAILDSLHIGGEVVREAVDAANSYPELLTRLGYSLVLEKQIHLQACYSRLGQAGGIKAVLPHHDIPTYSTLVTLVNFDSTLTTTPKSVSFFTDRVAELKTQLTK
jgi:hypothetical protein